MKTVMSEQHESPILEDPDNSQAEELTIEEILRRQSRRNVLRPSTTRLKSGLSGQKVSQEMR